jgi:hypothetical protein
MRNELEMWDGIAEKFKTKRKGIRTFQTPGDLQTVEDALQGYVNLLSSITSMTVSQPGAGRREHEDPSESSPPIGYLGVGDNGRASPEEKSLRQVEQGALQRKALGSSGGRSGTERG